LTAAASQESAGELPDRACEHGVVTALVVRCAAGDEAALKQLMSLFYGAAVAQAAARVPPGEVEDAVVRGFVRVWRRAGTFRPRADGAVVWVMDQLGSRADGDVRTGWPPRAARGPAAPATRPMQRPR
jgi:hypothetical protein